MALNQWDMVNERGIDMDKISEFPWGATAGGEFIENSYIAVFGGRCVEINFEAVQQLPNNQQIIFHAK